MLDLFASIYGNEVVPYTLISYGQELSNPITFIIDKVIEPDKNLKDKIAKIACCWNKEVEDVVFDYITNPFLRMLLPNSFKKLDKVLSSSSLYKELTKSIRDGKVLYIYDIDKVSSIVCEWLIRMLKSKSLNDLSLRLDKKAIVRLFMNLFKYENLNTVLLKLENRVKYLKSVLKDYHSLKIDPLWIKFMRYNPQGTTLPVSLHIYIKVSDYRYLELHFQVNYYDISRELVDNNDIKKLIKYNMQAIGYKALIGFMDYLNEYKNYE